MALTNGQNDKISIQCQDDPFGFNAQVVFENSSFPLRRCIPFLTVRRPVKNNLSRESHGSAFYGSPVVNEETLDNQDVEADGIVSVSVLRRQVGAN